MDAFFILMGIISVVTIGGGVVLLVAGASDDDAGVLLAGILIFGLGLAGLIVDIKTSRKFDGDHYMKQEVSVEQVEEIKNSLWRAFDGKTISVEVKEDGVVKLTPVRKKDPAPATSEPEKNEFSSNW